METIDHISARVTVATCIGAVTGTMSGMLKGYRIPRTAMLSAVSCGAVATACLIAERLTFIAIETYNPLSLISDKQIEPVQRQHQQQQQQHQQQQHQEEDRRIVSLNNLIASHACGGILGGAFTGLIYVQKPVAGALFITPIMCAVAYFEYRYQALIIQQELDVTKEITTEENSDNNNKL